MKNQLTFSQYRAIDLTLLGLALAVFEFIIVRAANWWFPGQPFTVSLAAAVTSIVYMRWGLWGALHALEAGLVFCCFSGATAISGLAPSAESPSAQRAAETVLGIIWIKYFSCLIFW